MPAPLVASTITPYDLRSAVERAHRWLVSTISDHLNDEVEMDPKVVPELARFVATVMPAVRMYERLVERLGVR